jgi:hypothetical protein
MKPHKILKSFSGNQSGYGPTEQFEEGTVANLSDHLAEVVVAAGFAKPTNEEAIEEKAIDEAPENKMAKPVKGKK